MRCPMLLALLIPLFVPISMARADTGGDWRARLGAERMTVSIDVGGRHELQTELPLDGIRGLDSVHAQTSHLVLERDPGTLTLDGHFDGEQGAGTFRFAPSATYVSSLRSRGLHPDEEDVLVLFFFDVTTRQIEALAQAGYPHLTLDELKQAGMFHVTPEWISQLAAEGFRQLTFEQLVQSRIFHLDPERVTAYRALLPKLTFDELLQLAIQKVDRDFISGLAQERYTRLSAEALVQLRIFQITPEWIRSFEPLGYRHLPPETLVSWKIHGVTPEFVASLERGQQKPTPDEVLERRMWPGR